MEYFAGRLCFCLPSKFFYQGTQGVAKHSGTENFDTLCGQIGTNCCIPGLDKAQVLPEHEPYCTCQQAQGNTGQHTCEKEVCVPGVGVYDKACGYNKGKVSYQISSGASQKVAVSSSPAGKDRYAQRSQQQIKDYAENPSFKAQ